MNNQIKDLPITPYLSEICSTLKTSPSRFLVLTAQTAAGKSTAVPLALLENFSGKILMLEPRKLATVAIASRVAELLGEEIGKTAGYSLHLETKVCSQTRFEVITEAILIRRLQKDPSLEGVNVVILDEFHERSIHADLSLAFLKEAMELRNDLYVVLMSATINSKKIAEYLSTPPAPIFDVKGRLFPVKLVYKDKTSVEEAIWEELLLSPANPQSEYRSDSILVFLPGIYEITMVKNKLKERLSNFDTEVFILHSTVPLSEQKKILSPVLKNSPRRIILSSAIAETSLTVPGVTTVIDSGYARFNKINLALGMEQLVTEKISQFSAEQRSGRAGRLAEGKCIRLWNELEVLNKETPPQILRSDLSSLVLECVQWGASQIENLDFLDSPNKAAWETSFSLLENLGLVKDKKITTDGRYALSLGLSPRLSNLALYGKKTNHINEALSFILKFSEYKNSTEQQNKFLNNIKRRLEKCTYSDYCKFNPSYLLLSGFPDRLAKKLAQDEQDFANSEKILYQFPSGRKAFLQGAFQNSPEWIIAPELDAGTTIGKIFTYEKINLQEISTWLEEHSLTKEIVNFEADGKSIKKREITSYGQIILKEKKLNSTPEDFGKALCTQIAQKGISVLPTNESTELFLHKALFFAKHKDKNLFEKIESLSSTTEIWLLPFITANKVTSTDINNALYWYLNGEEIEKSVPSVISLENGKKVKVQYTNRLNSDKLTNESLLTNGRSYTIEPVIEIIIQQIFGCFKTPTILGVPTLLKLLSPARRPLQITDDLEHFWSGAWVEICKEMKGRYPKHNWNYKLTIDN